MPLDIFTSPHIYRQHVKFIFSPISVPILSLRTRVWKRERVFMSIYRYLGMCFLVLPSRHLLFAKELCLPLFFKSHRLGASSSREFCSSGVKFPQHQNPSSTTALLPFSTVASSPTSLSPPIQLMGLLSCPASDALWMRGL